MLKNERSINLPWIFLYDGLQVLPHQSNSLLEWYNFNHFKATQYRFGLDLEMLEWCIKIDWHYLVPNHLVLQIEMCLKTHLVKLCTIFLSIIAKEFQEFGHLVRYFWIPCNVTSLGEILPLLQILKVYGQLFTVFGKNLIWTFFPLGKFSLL